LRAGQDRIGELLAIADLSPIDEDHHVLAQHALLVHDVAAQPRMLREHAIEDLAHARTRRRDVRTVDVSLEVRCEHHGRHARTLSPETGTRDCKPPWASALRRPSVRAVTPGTGAALPDCMKYGWLICFAFTAACVSEDISDDDIGDADLVDTGGVMAFATVKGVNSDYCTASPFNCRFHAGSSRVDTKGGDETWGITAGASVRDGNGVVLHTESAARLTFNYGQIRVVAG